MFTKSKFKTSKLSKIISADGTLLPRHNSFEFRKKLKLFRRTLFRRRVGYSSIIIFLVFYYFSLSLVFSREDKQSVWNFWRYSFCFLFKKYLHLDMYIVGKHSVIMLVLLVLFRRDQSHNTVLRLVFCWNLWSTELNFFLSTEISHQNSLGYHLKTFLFLTSTPYFTSFSFEQDLDTISIPFRFFKLLGFY